MFISNTQIDKIVHAINAQMNKSNVDLDADMLTKLNANLTAFFIHECDMGLFEENIPFESAPNAAPPGIASMDVAQQKDPLPGKVDTNPISLAINATIEGLSKKAAANCLFDLASGEINAQLAKAFSPDAIYEQVFNTGSLAIPNSSLEAIPYWRFLANENVPDVMGDIQSTVEVALRDFYLAITGNVQTTGCDFTLVDEMGETADDIHGHIDTSLDLGIALRFDGYSDVSSEDDIGTPIYIEHYEGELIVRVYADINNEEPTHHISLAGAKNSARLDETATA